MAQGNITNYIGNSAVETRSGNGKTFIKCYNDSTVVANGAIKVVVMKWITGLGVVAALTAPATNDFDTNLIGVVANDDPTGIPASSYGWVQIYGLCGSTDGITTSGTPAINQQLQVLNTGTAFIDAGAAGGAVELPETSAICVRLVATNLNEIFLLGKFSSIKSS